MPFFLKPGVMTWNQTSMSFDNEGEIRTMASTKLVSSSEYDLIYVDEAAFLPEKISGEIYQNLFSIKWGINTQIILSSTPNGFNQFHKIYSDAQAGNNIFWPNVIHWSQVPGRDFAWRDREIANMGSEAFNREYDLSFDSLHSQETKKEKEESMEKEKSLLERLERIESLLNFKSGEFPGFNRDWALKRFLGLSDEDIKKLGL